jgi:hypothetical protein
MEFSFKDYTPVHIYANSVLQLMKRYVSIGQIDAIDHDFEYPDASREYRDARCIDAMRVVLRESLSAELNQPRYAMPNSSLLSGTQFRSQIERPHRWFTVYMWHPFVKDLEDTNQILMTPALMAYIGNECSPDDLMVTTIFRYRLVPAQIQSFVAIIKQYLKQVNQSGIGGEGSVGLTDPLAVIQDNRISVKFDFSKSGQRSFNWLLLSIFTILNTATISSIETVDEITLEKRVGKARGKIQYRKIFGD